MATAFNPSDKSSNVALSNSNKTADNDGSAGTTNSGARCVYFATAGKYYFEFNIDSGAGANMCVGICKPAQDFPNFANLTNGGAATYRGSGAIRNNGAGTGSGIGSAFAVNDRIGVAVDLTNRKVWFRKNNVAWDNNGTHDPATNVGGFSTSGYDASGVTPAFGTNNSADTVTLHTLPSAWSFTAPSGFGELNPVNLIRTFLPNPMVG